MISKECPQLHSPLHVTIKSMGGKVMALVYPTMPLVAHIMVCELCDDQAGQVILLFSVKHKQQGERDNRRVGLHE